MMMDVSYRMKKRKEILHQLYRTSNAMCFLGLTGIILMIIDNEITFAVGEQDDTLINWLIKLIISITTIVLLILIIYYHKLDLTLFSLKNSIYDWRIGLTKKRIGLILIELIICSIHPFPRYFLPKWTYTSIPTNSEPLAMSHIYVDVILGLPMFIRLYLFSRFFVYHSHLARDASSQSLGYLNQVSINFSFIMKTYLEQWPIRCLVTFCLMTFFIGSWSLRACNYRPTTEHVPILDSMWLFIVTFTTVGYGDLTPSTYCGRSVAALIAFTGILSTALVVSVLTQKLVLTRWEKYVYNFVLNIELAKQRKHQSANAIKFAIRVWYLRRRNKSTSMRCMTTQWKLFKSINNLQKIKVKQRRLIDNCVVLADLIVLQRDENMKIERFVQDMNTMENTVENLNEKFQQMNFMMDNVQYKLNILSSRMCTARS